MMSTTVAPSVELKTKVRALPIFARLTEEEFACLDLGRERVFSAGEVLQREGEKPTGFFVLMEGALRVSRSVDGVERTIARMDGRETMGELALLSNRKNPVTVQAIDEGRSLEYSSDEFWKMMSDCPNFRQAILELMEKRVRGLQSIDVQQEKLVSLGTLTAGLMHELNNPGTAASRAASQLRVNLQRMHDLGKEFSEKSHSPEQLNCIWKLQERALHMDLSQCMGSLQQADAEDALAEWMESRDVKDAWRLAPALVASGISVGDMDCVETYFESEPMDNALQWLEAMVSSMQMVTTIEESITRVSDLVKAVKSYSHEGQGLAQSVDINESVHATLVILKHKILEKQITLEKNFAPNLTQLRCNCTGLNQVWTNVLDNAIDAAPQGGHIRVRTWQQDGEVFVGISDDGPGIPAENLTRIFDPFFTTKPVGVGTGLGLGIAHRIVTDYGGHIEVTSQPGKTEFVTQLPLKHS